MDLQLRDKRALITGSSSGIGEGIAKVLAREGAIVVIHGRKEEQANRVAQVWYNQVGRLARVEDIANLVAYVASPLADFINSANLRVDGGGTSTVN
ncbi:MAG: hypothetical protein CLLPBCKN_000803 [Chroococcidiopsis cubana SAG 39.79]|uniref:Short-chain dehydrogenase/reductase SDR n=2 Tax=Chroococcidiopsis TaxID=54298 RepID=K9U2A8_CHRTP|nr:MULTISPECIES: SDR family oxidoreductase [Chroococcidiopsis]AFY88748.1 short-chain dehydrogenase/reductase SDR [Chroococcidiopsis thermalis PCC 7203]MDZ4871415.1 hypothetical protein [Chroococcidiopsis cubana SAG 39.79]PSB56251.1 SDR family NAD(P)-dependent oxidoreductase [Chroococcidiopsis cubana CCALA 043]RUS94460.1 hypothetical protein DSM107010_71810 [Chroococcidiopsis cubana SAG 39.79]